MFLHFACHTYQTKISLSHNFPKFLYIISLSLYYQFVSYPAYVYDAYSLVQREFMAQLGYENVQAAGVEKTVVSPKIQQNILGVDYPVSVFAKAFQYFRLPVREFHFRSGMWRCTGSCIRQALCDGVESIIAYFKTGGFFGGAFCEVESLSRQRFDAAAEYSAIL